MTPEMLEKEFKKLRRMICCSAGEIVISGAPLSGSAGKYKAGVDTSTDTFYIVDSGGNWLASGGGAVEIPATEYDNNADALAALGVGQLYKSSTYINGSPIILITI